VSFFRLEPINRGLEPPSSWFWRIWKLVLPMNVNFDIYNKTLSGFLPFDLLCTLYDVLLNGTSYGYMFMKC
jgi:hypothetical protein